MLLSLSSFLGAALSGTPSANGSAALSPIDLMLGSSGVVLVVLILLICASTLVWVIWLAKWMQLGRLSSQHRRFEHAAQQTRTGGELLEVARQMKSAPGAYIVTALGDRLASGAVTKDLMSAIAQRAVAREEQRAGALMPTLSSIASTFSA